MQNDPTPNPDFDSIYSPETQSLVEATGLNVKLSDLSEISTLMDDTAGQANLAMDSFGPVTQHLAAAAKRDEVKYVENSRERYKQDLLKELDERTPRYRYSQYEWETRQRLSLENEAHGKRAETIEDPRVWQLINNRTQKDMWGVTHKLNLTDELRNSFAKEELYLTLGLSDYLGAPDSRYRIGFGEAMKNLHGIMNKNDFKFLCEALLSEGKRNKEDANAKFKLIYNLKDEIGQNFKLARAILEEDIGPKDNWIMQGKDFFKTNGEAFREFLHTTKEIILPDNGGGFRGYPAYRLFTWVPVCGSKWQEIKRLKTFLPKLRTFRSDSGDQGQLILEFAKDPDAVDKLEIFLNLAGEKSEEESYGYQEEYLLKNFPKRSVGELKSLYSWVEKCPDFTKEYGMGSEFIIRVILAKSPEITDHYLAEKFGEIKEIKSLLVRKYGEDRQAIESMVCAFFNYGFEANRTEVKRIIEGYDFLTIDGENKENNKGYFAGEWMDLPILWKLSRQDFEEVKRAFKKLPSTKMNAVISGAGHLTEIYKEDPIKLIRVIEVLGDSSVEAIKNGTSYVAYKEIYGEDTEKLKEVLEIMSELRPEAAEIALKALERLSHLFHRDINNLKELVAILNNREITVAAIESVEVFRNLRIKDEDIQKTAELLKLFSSTREHGDGLIIRTLKELGEFFDADFERLKEVFEILNSVEADGIKRNGFDESFWCRLEIVKDLRGEMGGDIKKLRELVNLINGIKGFSISFRDDFVRLYKVDPEGIEVQWPVVKERMDTLDEVLKDTALSRKFTHCAFENVESASACIAKINLLIEMAKEEPALLLSENGKSRGVLLSHFDQVINDNSEFKLIKSLLEKFEQLELGIKNETLKAIVIGVVFKFKSPESIKEIILNIEFMLSFIKTIPSLFVDPKQEAFVKWIMERFENLVQDKSDMDFIAQVLGRHGKTAEEIMAGYDECLKAGAITRADKGLVLEFLDRFRVVSPAIISGYKKAKAEGSHEVYCARLNDIAGRMTGAGKLTEEERKLPYYDDLLKEVYKNNVGSWTTHENNKTCEDRGADLSSYKIKPRYEIDLLGQSEVSLKEGSKSDKTKMDALVASIKKLTTDFEAQGYEPEKMKSSVAKKVNEYFEKIKDSCGIPATEAEALSTEEKISLLVLDSLYGKKKVEEEDLKNILISYEFAYFEDIRDYIQGTTDRVSRSSNPDYALLCELNTFFSDRIKEINKRVIESGFKNAAVAKVIPAYFDQLSRSTQSVERKGQIAKMQPEKLGATEAFLKQITRSLEGKTGKKYTPEEVRELIRRYEKMTGGLTETASTSPKQRTKALYGQLRSQREKTRQLAEFITGTEVDPRKIYLGEMNVAELLEAENSISGGTYDATQFEAYTVQKALGLFEEEKDFLTQELAKFVSAGGTERETLNAYIAKNKETANARMVGGVCVSGDNPGKVGPNCQWNMPNYFDLVLEDPDTHRCMGTVLLHSFDEDGKTLTASFNPSSTYLYKVDEKALFKGLLNTLISFAEENGFKRICSSQNTAIRTNRTGGIFEKAMAETITQMGKTYSFSEVKRFSFSPSYEIKDMDVLWESTATHST